MREKQLGRLDRVVGSKELADSERVDGLREELGIRDRVVPNDNRDAAERDVNHKEFVSKDRVVTIDNSDRKKRVAGGEKLERDERPLRRVVGDFRCARCGRRVPYILVKDTLTLKDEATVLCFACAGQ